MDYSSQFSSALPDIVRECNRRAYDGEGRLCFPHSGSVLAANDDSPSCAEDSKFHQVTISTSFAHRIFNTMASQENQGHSAPTTNHQNGEGLFPRSTHDRSTGNTRAGGREKSRSGGRGSSRGGGGQGHRGNGAGRGGRGGFNKKKEVGRAEWAYVNQTASSFSSGLIIQAVIQLTDEHVTPSELQNDKS